MVTNWWTLFPGDLFQSDNKKKNPNQRQPAYSKSTNSISVCNSFSLELGLVWSSSFAPLSAAGAFPLFRFESVGQSSLAPWGMITWACVLFASERHTAHMFWSSLGFLDAESRPGSDGCWCSSQVVLNVPRKQPKPSAGTRSASVSLSNLFFSFLSKTGSKSLIFLFVCLSFPQATPVRSWNFCL